MPTTSGGLGFHVLLQQYYLFGRMDVHKIFVYGSLRKGFGNYSLLAGAKYLGEALTEPRFTMLHLGGFPGIIESGETQILGEIYEVDDVTLARLDRLEGHPSFYKRTPIKVTEGSTGDKWQDVQVYVLPVSWASRQPAITSGDWSRKGLN